LNVSRDSFDLHTGCEQQVVEAGDHLARAALGAIGEQDTLFGAREGDKKTGCGLRLVF